MLSDLLWADRIVYLLKYINNSCIGKKTKLIYVLIFNFVNALIIKLSPV